MSSVVSERRFKCHFDRLPGWPSAWSSARLSTSENDNTFTVGVRPWDTSPRDRYVTDRREILEEALNAWRLNPLGRRIVE